MMKVLNGDWPADSLVTYTRSLTGKPTTINFQKSLFSLDRFKLSDIVSAEIVTADNHMSVGKKIGWGIAGGLLLGPVGAIIGGVAGGNNKEQVVAVVFRDGRKALIRGKTKELEPVVSAGFDWGTRGSAVPPPSESAVQWEADEPSEEIQPEPASFNRPPPENIVARRAVAEQNRAPTGPVFGRRVKF